MEIDSDNLKIKLKRINLLVSKHCNLRCRMCDYRLNTILTKQLSLEQITDLLRDAACLGLELLELSGGEPMTRKDIYQIVEFSKKLKIKTLMMTNGVLIGEEQTDNLLESGLSGVVISLEGYEDLNDNIRGAGSYKKAIAAIKSFQRYSDKIELIKVGITLSRYNYKDIYSFIKYLREDIGVNSISINPFNGDMLFERNFERRKEEFVIPQELISEVHNEIEKIILYSKEASLDLPPENYLLSISKYFSKCNMVPLSGCSDPLYGCSIDSNGGVYPCWGEPNTIGNIKDTSIKDIVMSDKYVQFCKNALKGKCKGCLSACHSRVHS